MARKAPQKSAEEKPPSAKRQRRPVAADPPEEQALIAKIKLPAAAVREGLAQKERADASSLAAFRKQRGDKFCMPDDAKRGFQRKIASYLGLIAPISSK
ncbi:MAG: hypothetical protein Q8P67_11235 [archaeon]|nr:hypothetical protein [archaeon]